MSSILVLEKKLPRGKFCVYNARPEFDLLKVKQTHSDIVLNESSCMDQEADGMVGTMSKPMAVLTADCVPVLLLGEHGHALIHAGWRGLHNQILNNKKVQEIKPFFAFIGPHIRQENYEVQPDFLSNFEDQKAFVQKDGKIFFNLSYVTHAQLAKFYPAITIEESKLDTFTDERLNSFRRNKTQERNWNVYIP